MTGVQFEDNFYVYLGYEYGKMLDTDTETLDYISQTMNGDISIQMRCITESDSPKVELHMRSMKYNPDNQWNQYSLLKSQITHLYPSSVENKGNEKVFTYPCYRLEDFHMPLEENVFLSIAFKEEKINNLRLYIQDSSKKLNLGENKRICYEFIRYSRKYIETGAFAKYDKGIKFFPNTNIATLFQDLYL